MRRFVTLVVLLLFSIPFGVSISGCSKYSAPEYCNGGDSGIVTGQPTTITLQPVLYGVSLNFAQINQVNLPSATDCKGNSVTIGGFTYATTDMTIADIQPSSGRLCGGTWNRNSGGGIPDYTYCIPTNKGGVAYVSTSAAGVTSNPVAVYVHPVVTSIVLGGPSSNCTTDPTTACSPAATMGAVTAPPYLTNSCLSQGQTAELVARVYAGIGADQTNISLLAGHLQFTTSSSTVASIDQNGVITANQPGSVLITATVSNAASSAGTFSTCPPASITLTPAGTSSNPVIVDQNNPQALQVTALDTNGVTLTGLDLEYESTSPITIPVLVNGTVTPTLAGAASITAACQPPACNPSAYDQIGLFGNGKPITSNSVNIVAPGTNSTVLYMASTQSQDVVQDDFTTGVVGSPFQLPYVPNSMVISNDGATIYMGSSSALMVLSAVQTLALTRTDVNSPGTVLALSPDGTGLVIADPVHGITTIENSSGSVVTTYGGVGTRAEYTPDNHTVYITMGNQLLVYSYFTGWTNITPATPEGTPVTDVAVTVPSIGAYFAGSTTTARGYCSASTQTTQNGTTTETNVFYPLADSSTAITDRIAATNDGLHILGATVTPTPTLNDLRVTVPIEACPATGGIVFSNILYPTSLAPITATAITGVVPASDSSVAFVTYTGSSGLLPAYAPAATGTGATTYIKLSGAATAPIAGVISTDNTMFFAATSGDNLVHLISHSSLTDTSTLAPKLTNPSGTPVPVNLMAQKPRKTT